MSEIQPTNKTDRNKSVSQKPRMAKKSKSASTEPASDKVSLSQTSKAPATKKNGGPVIREDLVKKFQGHLKDGTYTVKAQEIADKMIQKIRENKTRLML